jgi:ribosomal protein S18 acetylase RimI-like enzyme
VSFPPQPADRRVVEATPDDAPALGQLIAQSFIGINTTDWLFRGDDPTGERILSEQFAMIIEHATKHGVVHKVADGNGVAVWFDNTTESPRIDRYDERLQGIAGSHYPRVSALDAAFAAHHPNEPHHHLALLAVRPGWQGQGLGSALMDHHHRLLDAEELPAFLETSTDNARRLYLRHGYRPLAAPYDLPDGGPAFHPLWREAQ